MEQSSIVGVAVDYAQLRQLLSMRARELGLRHLEIDDLAGLQGGYSSKLFCGLRHFGDMSMGAMLGALNVSLVIVKGPMLPAGKQESLSDLAKASIEKRIIRQRKFSQIGNAARSSTLTPKQRREIARYAARVRWTKYRASRPAKLKAKKTPPIVAGLLTGPKVV